VVADVSIVCGLAIIDVTDRVADGHEESIVNENEQVSDVNNQESLGDSGTAMCNSGGTEFSPLKVPELMHTILSKHAVLTVQSGC